LRVLVVAHNAVAESNRRRVEALADLPHTEVALLTPPWWYEEGRRIEVRPAAADSSRLTAPAAIVGAAAAAPSRPPSSGATDSRLPLAGPPGAARQAGRRVAWHVGRTLATGNGTRYVYASGLAGLVRRWRPDVIDVHEEPFSLAAVEVLLAREVLAPRAALVFYSAVNLERRWRLPYRLAERLVLAAADAAYVPSGEVSHVLRAKGYAAPLEVIPLGVDLERFKHASAAALDQPRPRVGFLGRLEPVKGVDVLIEAAARLRAEASVVIAGDGPEHARLRRVALERGVAERVGFLGQVDYSDVPAFLKALDVLVLPSVSLPPLHTEQFGRVLVEAMAAGVPVVGSSSGAIPEVIGDAGLVVPEGDPGALASALDRLLADAALRSTLVARASQRVASQYAWPVVAARTRELYLRAVAHRLGRGAGAAWREVVESRA
jgi:glycosyltransferase involved in cell wall biosynthesis